MKSLTYNIPSEFIRHITVNSDKSCSIDFVEEKTAAFCLAQLRRIEVGSRLDGRPSIGYQVSWFNDQVGNKIEVKGNLEAAMTMLQDMGYVNQSIFNQVMASELLSQRRNKNGIFRNKSFSLFIPKTQTEFSRQLEVKQHSVTG